jgi:cytochrome c-type biogenesis protein CcmH/NrfG
MKYKCPKCGAEITENVKFCPECGTAQKSRKKVVKSAAQPAKPVHKPSLFKGINLIYLVMLLSLVVVGVYGYRYVKPVNNTDPHASLQQAGRPAFDQTHYQHLLDNLKANPDGLEENVELGNFLFDNQRFNEAIPYYKKALEIKAAAPDIIVDAGVCYYNLKQFEQAKDYFEKALALDKNHVNALYNLGIVSAQLGEMPKVVEYWERLIQVAPESEQAQAAKRMIDQIRNSTL